MIVITMTNCPPRLRGDLSKWLCEINTGVYVGQLSARVREALWDRVCEYVESGQATMVYSAANEQHMRFVTHNSAWKPVDYDGITLMQRPIAVEPMQPELKPGYSNAAKQQMARRHRKKGRTGDGVYAVLDIETTGLNPEQDAVIEIGVVTASDGACTEQWSTLLHPSSEIPEGITQLTGITTELCQTTGIAPVDALQQLAQLVHERTVLCYNLEFEFSFLRRQYQKWNLPFPITRSIDVLPIARRVLPHLPNHRLETVAAHYAIAVENQHRALADCALLFQVFLKLNEN